MDLGLGFADLAIYSAIIASSFHNFNPLTRVEIYAAEANSGLFLSNLNLSHSILPSSLKHFLHNIRSLNNAENNTARVRSI